MKIGDSKKRLLFGALELMFWLIHKGKKGKCPKCNYPITDKSTKRNNFFYTCPNCGQGIDWVNFDQKKFFKIQSNKPMNKNQKNVLILSTIIFSMIITFLPSMNPIVFIFLLTSWIIIWYKWGFLIA